MTVIQGIYDAVSLGHYTCGWAGSCCHNTGADKSLYYAHVKLALFWIFTIELGE